MRAEKERYFQGRTVRVYRLKEKKKKKKGEQEYTEKRTEPTKQWKLETVVEQVGGIRKNQRRTRTTMTKKSDNISTDTEED